MNTDWLIDWLIDMKYPTFDDEPDVVCGLRHGVLKEARIETGVGAHQVAEDKPPGIVGGHHPRSAADIQLTSVFEPGHARSRHAERVASHLNVAAFATDEERRWHASQRRRRCWDKHTTGTQSVQQRM